MTGDKPKSRLRGGEDAEQWEPHVLLVGCKMVRPLWRAGPWFLIHMTYTCHMARNPTAGYFPKRDENTLTQNRRGNLEQLCSLPPEAGDRPSARHQADGQANGRVSTQLATALRPEGPTAGTHSSVDQPRRHRTRRRSPKQGHLPHDSVRTRKTNYTPENRLWGTKSSALGGRVAHRGP